jgi:hypothetical protein
MITPSRARSITTKRSGKPRSDGLLNRQTRDDDVSADAANRQMDLNRSGRRGIGGSSWRRGYCRRGARWPLRQMKRFAQAIAPLFVFGFIMWLGIGALSHPENSDARVILGLMVVTVAVGAATLLHRHWKS